MSKEIKTMRLIAWERAKGELFAVLHTYWTEEEFNNYMNMKNTIENFVKKVEEDRFLE